jgi:uncharacterized protein
MVLNLKSVLSGLENPLSFRYEADMSDYEIYGIRPFRSGVFVSGMVQKKPGFLALDMEISAVLDTLCASCGKAIKKSLNVKTHNLLVRHTDSDDEEYIVYANDEVNLDEIVNDAVTLSIEMRPLCKEDCKGVCPGCGVDLNEAECRCQKPVNPAFEKLKGKFFNNK